MNTDLIHQHLILFIVGTDEVLARFGQIVTRPVKGDGFALAVINTFALLIYANGSDIVRLFK